MRQVRSRRRISVIRRSGTMRPACWTGPRCTAWSGRCSGMTFR